MVGIRRSRLGEYLRGDAVKPLKIALACGGTGGHVFPGLATAEALRARGHDVTLWLAGKTGESVAVKGWTGDVRTIPAEGLDGGLSWRTARAMWRLARAIRRCGRQMDDDTPNAVLAMGSYASVGPVLAAKRRGIPVVLHESNVIPGRAISLLYGVAAAVAAVFEETRAYLRRRRLFITGMPLRAELVRAAAEGRPDRAPNGPFTVLVAGGSRGARRLNELASQALPRAFERGLSLRVIHLAGTEQEASVREVYRQAGLPHEVHAFCHDMGEAYRRADLAICRAGASTCAELLAFGLPALLVPFPFAIRHHQSANARAMERMGAADWVEEADCEEDWLVEYVVGQARAPERLARMRTAARGRARLDAANALAELVEKTACEYPRS